MLCRTILECPLQVIEFHVSSLRSLWKISVAGWNRGEPLGRWEAHNDTICALGNSSPPPQPIFLKKFLLASRCWRRDSFWVQKLTRRSDIWLTGLQSLNGSLWVVLASAISTLCKEQSRLNKLRKCSWSLRICGPKNSRPNTNRTLISWLRTAARSPLWSGIQCAIPSLSSEKGVSSWWGMVDGFLEWPLGV